MSLIHHTARTKRLEEQVCASTSPGRTNSLFSSTNAVTHEIELLECVVGLERCSNLLGSLSTDSVQREVELPECVVGLESSSNLLASLITDSVLGEVERLKRVVGLKRCANLLAPLSTDIVVVDVEFLERFVGPERSSKLLGSISTEILAADDEAPQLARRGRQRLGYLVHVHAEITTVHVGQETVRDLPAHLGRHLACEDLIGPWLVPFCIVDRTARWEVLGVSCRGAESCGSGQTYSAPLPVALAIPAGQSGCCCPASGCAPAPEQRMPSEGGQWMSDGTAICTIGERTPLTHRARASRGTGTACRVLNKRKKLHAARALPHGATVRRVREWIIIKLFKSRESRAGGWGR
eukprot:m.256375 g.256375  ORF g.256375 m.256375 type:complete len:352 (-) comp26570_c0_seq15:276-1331(-)